MRNFLQQIESQVEKLNGQIQELNNENPAESRLIICPQCRELFTDDKFWIHEIDCDQAPQDDPIRALAEYLTQDDPTDFPILERLLQKTADALDDDFDHEPDRPRICADEKWRSRS